MDTNPISVAGNLASGLIGAIAPQTKNQAEGIALEMTKTQTDVNLAEARSGSFFLAGPRPMLMWICDLVIFCYFIPYIIVSTIMWAYLCWETKHLQPRPAIEVTDLLGLLIPLLYGGTTRTLEKFRGVDTQTIKK